VSRSTVENQVKIGKTLFPYAGQIRGSCIEDLETVLLQLSRVSNQRKREEALSLLLAGKDAEEVFGERRRGDSPSSDKVESSAAPARKQRARSTAPANVNIAGFAQALQLLRQLEKDAEVGPSALIEYTKLVLPLYDEELYKKLKLLSPLDSGGSEDVESLLKVILKDRSDVMLWRASYVRGEAGIVERLDNVLCNWLDALISNKQCGLYSRPSALSCTCPKCGGDLLWEEKSARNILWCPGCEEEYRIGCPICDYVGLEHRVRKSLTCPNCSYRLIFEKEIITREYIFRCLRQGINDPRIEDLHLAFRVKKPDGSFEKVVLKETYVHGMRELFPQENV